MVSYHPGSMPDMEMKFKDHAHLNDYLNVTYGDEEKYDFQYI